MAPSFEDGKSLFNFVVRDGNGVKGMLDGPDHDQVANDFANAAEVLGFFQVLNHGMPLELLESLKSSANDFFGQAPENKAAYRKGVSPSPYVKYGTSFVPENEKALEWKDYLSMILSNGRYKSAEHRARTKSSQSRVSVPIFTIPKATERIGPLPEVVESYGVARYREVVFEDYMNNFFSIAHDGKKSLDYATRSCKRYPVMLNKLSDCAIQN
nr:scopoletin 8-hydroxylase-like [Malus domestica]